MSDWDSLIEEGLDRMATGGPESVAACADELIEEGLLPSADRTAYIRWLTVEMCG